MARETERDTYGGERRWQQGAGVSWTSPTGGGLRQHQTDRQLTSPGASFHGSEPRSEEHSKPGFFRRITDELGLTTPDAAPPRRGPKGYRRSDERIREDVCENLIREHRVDVSEVTVEVQDGTVTLEGSVPERRMRYMIEDIAADCRGVNDVDNRVRVRRVMAGANLEGSGT